jgi:hypothetical protein
MERDKATFSIAIGPIIAGSLVIVGDGGNQQHALARGCYDR